MPHLHTKAKVAISGGGMTSLKLAQKYVKRGLAHWGQHAELVFARSSTDHREASKNQSQLDYDRSAHRGLATMADLANIPVVAAGVLMNFGRRKGASRRTFTVTQGF